MHYFCCKTEINTLLISYPTNLVNIFGCQLNSINWQQTENSAKILMIII
jgi:hypothetical protein